MRFMMIVKATEEFEAGVLPGEKMLSEMAAYTEELVKAGALVDAGRLQPSSSGIRVHYADGKFTVTDGPFAETKELIAGFTMCKVKSMVDAIACRLAVEKRLRSGASSSPRGSCEEIGAAKRQRLMARPTSRAPLPVPAKGV